jgi:hypothetical protein
MFKIFSSGTDEQDLLAGMILYSIVEFDKFIIWLLSLIDWINQDFFVK